MPTVQQARSIIDLMHETSLEIYAKKLDALQHGDEAVREQIGYGKDIMSILCTYPIFQSHLCFLRRPFSCYCSVKANSEATEEDRLPDDEILGQIRCDSRTMCSFPY